MRELDNYKIMNYQYNLKQDCYYCEDDIIDYIFAELEYREES